MCQEMIRLCAFADEANENFDGQIIALKRNNIDLIELRTINGVNIKDITIEDAVVLSEKLKKNGIAVWAIGSPIGKIDIDCDFDEYKQTVRKICELANIFGAKRVRIFSFFNAYQKDSLVFARLQEIINIGKEYSVYMCHENEKEIYGDVKDRVLKLIKNVEGLKTVFDPANFIQSDENVKLAFDELKEYTDYYHVKDVDAKTGEIVPAGEGDGMIKYMVDCLDDVVMTIEPHLKVFSGYAMMDNTTLKSNREFKDGDQAFDFAVKSFKKILIQSGYVETNGGFIKK